MKCDHSTASGAHMRGSIEATPRGGGAEYGTWMGAGWEGGHCQSSGARFRPRAQHPRDGREAQDEVPKQSSDRKAGAQALYGGGEPGLWAGGAAAVASPSVAGSIGDRLVSYVQRWAWARDVLKAPPFHCDIIS